MACPAPFLAPSDFSLNEGYIPGRFCGTITSDLACCLPCPTEDWLYSDSFKKNINIGTWFNIPSLISQVFLLVTFCIWHKEISHRHYLSVGLCISLILLHLAFLIPLGTKPEVCANALTPNDMYSSMSCAWSGALIEAGAMGISVWVLVRALWMHLRVCWDINLKRSRRAWFWAAQAIGWGLPGLFLAVSFPISGVSYRVGPTCFPNTYKSFITWFGWLIAFGCLATAIQFTTTVFCLWVYLRDIIRGDTGGKTTSATNASRNSTYNQSPEVIQSTFDAEESSRRTVALKRVKKVFKSQWRSMVLCIGLSVFSIYFGAIFVSQARTGANAASGKSRDALVTWAFCLITNNGDKTPCGGVGKAIGLNENMVVAIWPLAGLLGLLTFLLMVRGTMFTGWWQLIRYQRRGPEKSFGRAAKRKPLKPESRPIADADAAGSDDEKTVTTKISYPMQLGSDRPAAVSPANSEFPSAADWPMSAPPQTSTQRISRLMPRRPEPEPAPTGGFDSSSDEDEEEHEAVRHSLERRGDHNFV